MGFRSFAEKGMGLDPRILSSCAPVQAKHRINNGIAFVTTLALNHQINLCGKMKNDDVVCCN